MTQKRKIQEVIFNWSEYDGYGWPPCDPAGFIAWFQGHIDRIPEEFREIARIDLRIQSGYDGDSFANIEIAYLRDETDEELFARLDREKFDELCRVESEKQTLKTLMAKYGEPKP